MLRHAALLSAAWVFLRALEVFVGVSILTAVSYFFPYFGDVEVIDRVFASFIICMTFIILSFYVFFSMAGMFVRKPVLNILFHILAFIVSCLLFLPKSELNVDFQKAYWLLVLFGMLGVSAINGIFQLWRQKQ